MSTARLFGFLLLVLTGFLSAVPASAASSQTAVYAEISASNYGYSFNGDSLTISTDHPAFAFGAFYNFPIASRATFGVDGHGSFASSSTGGAKGFISARVGFVPNRNPLRPYFQLGVGEVHARVPRSSLTVGPQAVNHLALDLALGLDIRVSHSFDYRLFELEGGAGGKGSTSSGSASLSTGIVYHFPTARQNP